MPDNLLPEGFKDEVSNQAAIEHKYKNKIINLFQSHGYELVKTPLVEFADQINKINTLKIKVKKDQKELSLRDDITMQIARLSSSRLSKKPRPLKICYYGEVLRDKGSMLRPERQFLQIGAECIGENSYLADVEMIELAYNALGSVGIKNISIELSSKVFLDKLYKLIRLIPELDKIKYFIGKKDINGALELLENKHHEYLNNIFSCTGNLFHKKKQLNKLKVDKRNISEINSLINIYDVFISKYPNVNFLLDLTEIDDKNYHNSIRFTIFADNVRGEIARGGRYISNNGDDEENATGFTCYMDTILRASSNIEKINKIMIPFDILNNNKKELITQGFTIETFFGDSNNIRQMAIKKNCQFYLTDNQIIKLDR
jgi:ATP phosphoribosyltransferase regulatory subunit